MLLNLIIKMMSKGVQNVCPDLYKVYFWCLSMTDRLTISTVSGFFFSSRDIKPDNILLDEHGKILSLLAWKHVDHSTIHVIEIILLVEYNPIFVSGCLIISRLMCLLLSLSFICEGWKENITLKEVWQWIFLKKSGSINQCKSWLQSNRQELSLHLCKCMLRINISLLSRLLQQKKKKIIPFEWQINSRQRRWNNLFTNTNLHAKVHSVTFWGRQHMVKTGPGINML